MNYNFENKNQSRVAISSDKGFKYDADSHCYTLDGIKLKNTTSWIEEFKKKVDFSVIASVLANSNKNKNKGIQNENLIKKIWELKGEHARHVGNEVHTFARLYWLTNCEHKPKTNYDEIVARMLDSIMEKYDIIDMETPRGNMLYMMGYTMDMVIRRKSDGIVLVADFKTNEYFSAEDYKNAKGRLPGNLLEPFNNMRDVLESNASIQLHVYKHLNNTNEERTFDINGCIILHISPDMYPELGYAAYSAIDVEDLVVKELAKEINYSKSIISKL